MRYCSKQKMWRKKNPPFFAAHQLCQLAIESNVCSGKSAHRSRNTHFRDSGIAPGLIIVVPTSTRVRSKMEEKDVCQYQQKCAFAVEFHPSYLKQRCRKHYFDWLLSSKAEAAVCEFQIRYYFAPPTSPPRTFHSLPPILLLSCPNQERLPRWTER